MTRLRWFGVAITTAAVTSGVLFGASGLAATHATHATHSNYRGPARAAPVVKLAHHSNYHGPARVAARATVHGSNRPASVNAQGGAQR